MTLKLIKIAERVFAVVSLMLFCTTFVTVLVSYLSKPPEYGYLLATASDENLFAMAFAAVAYLMSFTSRVKS